MKRFNLNTVPALVLHIVQAFVAALAAFGGSGSPAAGQEAAQTFRACLVPQVGAMYLIGIEGLPAECLSDEHREISWTEGGALEDGSVGTEALQNASVTTAKIAQGAVTAAGIADGAIRDSHIADNTMGGSKIVSGSLPGSKLRFNAVGGRELDLEMDQIFESFVVPRRSSDGTPTRFRQEVGCPDGKELVTGGFRFSSWREGMTVLGSHQFFRRAGEDTWAVSIRNAGTEDGRVGIYVLCGDLR